ncbi:glycosyltransferase [Muribaculaceae bacterium Isolate-042 (Harlan)]|uniref:glycosyltransferase n=1 Tax=Muribaculum intestinale TaxID=1796646 RepID=UPI000F49D57E|nr:glycosyltransferase [Muribaculum intestinale]ROS81633.1 glycosyltransferase [Muribaculaceae bacterium Isolate-042 (Harlan)]
MNESKRLPRVLVVNKFYYRRGGDCVYTLNLEHMLRSAGHEVAVFAMRYPLNESADWEDYFPTEVSFSGSLTQKLRAVRRMLGSDDVASCFTALLNDFRPEIVHLNNIHSYLSPALASIAHALGIKVVWTLHDYKLLCPSYSRLSGGKVCDRCHSSRFKTCVLHTRCMKSSGVASILAWIESLRWRRRMLSRDTDAFICPSAFMAHEMELGKYPVEKLYTLNNFIPAIPASPTGQRGKYYCYVGRLSEEKGVETLLEAATMLQHELRIAGSGPLYGKLKAKYDSWPQITFLGQLDSDGVAKLLGEAACSVLPSEWYENNPLGIIESLCAGTPVVGAEIGGIPELIDDNNGLTFTPGDSKALAAAIDAAVYGPWNHEQIRRDAISRFNPETYYARLLSIYKSIL